MLVKLNINNLDEYPIPSINIDKNYYVVEIQNEYIRIIDNNLEPILFPIKIFDIVENKIESDWIITLFDDGEFSLTSPLLADKYFFEDYFDGNKDAKDKWQAYINTIKSLIK